MKQIFTECKSRGWRDVSTPKSTGCSPRGPGLSSQHLHGNSQLSAPPVPGYLMSLLAFAGTGYTKCRYTCVQNPPAHKMINLKKKKKHLKTNMEVEIKENRMRAISCSEDGMPVSPCFPGPQWAPILMPQARIRHTVSWRAHSWEYTLEKVKRNCLGNQTQVPRASSPSIYRASLSENSDLKTEDGTHTCS